MTDQTTETRVAEIEKRAEKATEGPWEWSGAGGEYYGLRSLKGKDVLEVHDGIVYSEYSSDSATVSCGYEDSLFIAHARSDIPWLTAQLRAAWKHEAALREAVEWYGENARLCRLIHSGGDEGRKALSDDGGRRASTALQETADER